MEENEGKKPTRARQHSKNKKRRRSGGIKTIRKGGGVSLGRTAEFDASTSAADSPHRILQGRSIRAGEEF